MQLPVSIPDIVAYLWSLLTSGVFWAGALVPTLGIVILRLRTIQSDSITVGLPFGLGSATYKTTPADRIVAWKLYVQLVTRKAALPFDEECDLINDVYDSLYELVKITRDLLLELPAHDFQRPEGVASLMLRVLNDGLRPHLTRWQAEFRDWLKKAYKSQQCSGLTPHQIQQKYPRYQELVADLKRTNTELSKFADELRDIARATKRKRPPKIKVVPLPPTIDREMEETGKYAARPDPS